MDVGGWRGQSFLHLDGIPGGDELLVQCLVAFGLFGFADLIDGMADDLVFGEMEDIEETPVDHKITSPQVFDIEHRRGIVEDRLEQQLLFVEPGLYPAELLLHAFLFGDIADETLKTLGTVGSLEEEGGLFDPFAFAGTADAGEFEVGFAGSDLYLGIVMFADDSKIFGGHERGEVTTDELLRGITGKGMDPGAGKLDLPADVGRIDDSADIIDKLAIVIRLHNLGVGRWERLRHNFNV